jgi:hypothetical protein
MRYGTRAGMSPAFFNMSRTDAAGIAMLVAVVVFVAVAIKVLRD